MTACTVYWNGLKMGTGDLVADATNLTSWSQDGGWTRAVEQKNVQISVGSLGTFNTRIIADNTTDLDLKDACPFTGAS